MLNQARLLCGTALLAVLGTVYAAEPKIAITDLTYQERVSEYFRMVSASSRSNVSARGSERGFQRDRFGSGHQDPVASRRPRRTQSRQSDFGDVADVGGRCLHRTDDAVRCSAPRQRVEPASCEAGARAKSRAGQGLLIG